MKRILIHSIVFYPDGVSTAYLYNDIALGFQSQGFDVVVLSTTPHYNFDGTIEKKNGFTKKCLGLYYESFFNGIKIYHIPQNKHKSSSKRIINFIWWHFISLLVGLFKIRYDYIISPSPPLTIGFVSIILAKIKKAKVIYNVQEIYPDLLINQNGLKNKFLISILKWLERFVYNHSDAITTIDVIFYKTIASRCKNPKKLYIIPNFVDTDFYKPGIISNDFIIEKNDNSNFFKLMYAGNIGHAQDWETLIQLSKELTSFPVIFYLIGDGALKDFLVEKIRANNIKNIRIFPYQKRENMPIINVYADVHFIFMNKNSASQGFPSKVYSILSSGKPLLVSSTLNSPIINFLKDFSVGYIITEEDECTRIEKLKSSIITYINNPSLHRLHSHNARMVVEKNYSKSVIVNKYIQLIQNI